MALPLPDLDTRRWDDLVAEATALIPRFAPGWTDHNLHDPGIMLVELLAALTEQGSYRVNRVPIRHRRKFLRLLGFRPQPPRPARTYLTFTLDPAADPAQLPAGSMLTGRTQGGAAVPFRTLAPVTVCGLGLLTVQRADGSGFTDLTRDWRDRLPLQPWGADPAATGDPERDPSWYLGFDRPPPVDVPVRMWVEVAAGPDARDRLAEYHRDTHHSVVARWELWDGTRWRELAGSEVVDGTRGLSLPGAVVLTLPVAVAPLALGGALSAAHYVRCRLAEGRPDAPPAVADVVPNSVVAEQAAAVSDAPLGVGTGAPWQRVSLPAAPVAGGELALWTVENGVTRQWRQRPDLDASGRADPDFVLDATAGWVGFGDGERGEVVPSGAAILASYHETAAELGNLPAGSAWELADAAQLPGLWGIANRAPATGGAAEEPDEAAAGRASAAISAHERLVELAPAPTNSATLDQLERAEVRSRPAPARATTLLDYERLALDVPGTEVARVRAWADRDPRWPGLTVPGTVSVIVVPYLPRSRPEPTAGLLAAVRCHLEPRRTVGTRLAVAGPRYREVSVRARVRVAEGTEAGPVLAQVTAALDGFLDPLTGGPAGRGWPFGRDVYRTEMMHVIASVSGVDYVRDLRLSAAGQEADCTNLCVPPMWLVAPGTHAIETEAA